MAIAGFTTDVATTGEKIEALLKRRGESPAWLAKKINAPKANIYKWIEGTKPQGSACPNHTNASETPSQSSVVNRLAV